MSESSQQAVVSNVDAGPVGKLGRPSFARTLSFFGFFAITASMVMTVYEYPSFASSGFQLVFFSHRWRLALVFASGYVRCRNGNRQGMGIWRYFLMGR